jgi:hypothetical protein
MHVSVFELADRIFSRLFRLMHTATVYRIPWSLIEPRHIQKNETGIIQQVPTMTTASTRPLLRRFRVMFSYYLLLQESS